VFGEAEFWLSSFKILTIVGLMLFGLIIDFGGNPAREVIGFRYWVKPGPMGTWWDSVVGNTDLSRLVGLGSALGKYSSSHVLPFMGQTHGSFSVGDERVYWNGTGRQPVILSDSVANSFIIQIGVTVGEAENPRKTIPIGESHPVKEYKYAQESLTSHQTE
jgi:amino acid permease